MAVPPYIRDPEEIYRQSFLTIEQEACLDRLPDELRPVAVRLVHACGMVDIADDLQSSPGAVASGWAALDSGAPVFSDVEMVRSGIITRLLPAQNDVHCLLNREGIAAHAKKIGNTRSAAAVDFWPDHRLAGSIVVIGNAPTALFRLLERLDEGAARPALIIAMPVGFVGAAESKQELAENPRGCQFITLHGRRGGSAMAAAAINAVAAGLATAPGVLAEPAQ